MFQEVNDWIMKRCGKFTSSEIHKLIPNGRAKGEAFSQTGKTYIKQKAAEALTLEPIQKPTTYAMEWGASHENEALVEFEKQYGEIEKFGGGNPVFFEKDKYFGGSPDGVMGDCVIEVKCPFNSAEHLEHLLFKTEEDLKDYAPEYYWQLVANMIILGKEKAAFISYDPRFDGNLQMKVLKFDLNQVDADLLKKKIAWASAELESILGNI